MTKRRILILATIVAIGASRAFASGFGFYEQGAKASGQAGAWVARADDASANWYNPAALANLSGMEVDFGLNYLEAGNDTQFRLASGTSFNAVSNTETPGHFYFSQKINDKLAWGVGLNNPFGLVSEWNNAPLTLSSRRAELHTYLFNPNLAFKLGNRWSFALGADYLAAEVNEFERDVPGGSTANLTGEGDAWGYNFAFQFKMDQFSLGGQYRSSLRPNVTGNIDFGAPLAFLDSPASAHLDLPGQTLLGAAWTGKWVDVEIGGYYTQWNYFKSLDVDATSPTTPDIHLVENWTGTWSYRLGLAFRLSNSMKHELRAGYVYDKSPVPVETLRPSIPDSRRTGYSLGYGYASKRWGIDAYAMDLLFADATAVAGETGVIPGTYSTTIWLAGVTAKYRF